MRKFDIKTLFFLAAVCWLCCSCASREDRSKVMLNEVMVQNESDFQDDYGQNGPWIEIFNRTYGTVDLAGYYLKHSCVPGDTAVYFIPKGDILTQVKSHQHALFWADGQPRHGTFHTNFRLDPEKDNWIGLFDSGRKLLDQVVVPSSELAADCSWARVSDAARAWEVKDGSEERYVTPSTNNKTIDSNPKMEKFAEHDSIGVGMAISAMCVVFFALLLLFVVFRIVSNVSVNLSKRNAMKSTGIDKKEQDADHKQLGQVPGEVYAAIAMAMHEFQSDVHDVEDTTLTIQRVKRSYSPWSSKIYTLRETPNKK